jgi:CheY-like chemotaxis protein
MTQGKKETVKGRILIVEDDPAVRMAFVTYFETLGYFVAEEEQGNKGLHTYRTAKEPWTFVVSDFQFIPGLSIKNGADLVAAILADNPEQRLCIHSGEPDMAYRALSYLQSIKKLSPDAEVEVLQKPVRLKDLRLIIEK